VGLFIGLAGKGCVACLSGLDSFAYAVQWAKRGFDVYPLVFHYGQKGFKEVGVAVGLSMRLGFRKAVVVTVNGLRDIYKGTQLMDDAVGVQADYNPNIVVPLRNVLFMTVAAGYALSLGVRYVLVGAHKGSVAPRADTGEPEFPDCSLDTAHAVENVVKVAHFPVGVDKVEIWSPLREGLTKAENIRRGYDVAGDVLFHAWSCHVSGLHHCGMCETCTSRHRAVVEAGILDRTEYRTHPIVTDLCLKGGCGVKI
jgi:7-cyano-7-deazaguanine synthase